MGAGSACHFAIHYHIFKLSVPASSFTSDHQLSTINFPEAVLLTVITTALRRNHLPNTAICQPSTVTILFRLIACFGLHSEFQPYAKFSSISAKRIREKQSGKNVPDRLRKQGKENWSVVRCQCLHIHSSNPPDSWKLEYDMARQFAECRKS